MSDRLPPFTAQEFRDLYAAIQYVDVREETVARMMSTLLEWMPDGQIEERLQSLTAQVHNQHQELISVKRERDRLNREVEQLKQLLPFNEPLGEPREQGAAPVSFKNVEEELPVQNQPLSTSLSPEKEPQVLEDPQEVTTGVTWSDYYCDLVIALIAQYPETGAESIDTWAHAMASNLLDRAKERFPKK